MSARIECPNCHSHAVALLPMSLATVEYFSCQTCQHIWNLPKGRDEPVQHVTPLRKTPTDRSS